MQTDLPSHEPEYYMSIFQLDAKHRIRRVFTISPDTRTASSRVGQLPGDEITTLEVGLLEQRLILVGHDIGLYLRHEIHTHHHDNQ